MQKKEELRVVVIFVFYHGEKGWHLGTGFLDILNKDSIPEKLLKFNPNFQFNSWN